MSDNRTAETKAGAQSQGESEKPLANQGDSAGARTSKTLVQRLRDLDESLFEIWHDQSVAAEAADEIERLQRLCDIQRGEVNDERQRNDRLARRLADETPAARGKGFPCWKQASECDDPACPLHSSAVPRTCEHCGGAGCSVCQPGYL